MTNFGHHEIVNLMDFSIEDVFKSGWQRFKDRFLTVFLTILITYLLIIVGILGIGILVGIPVVLYLATKSLLFIPMIILVVVAGIVLFLYLVNWLFLAQITAITRPDRLEVIANIKDVRKKAFKYMVFSWLYGTFLIGLTFFFVFPVLPWIVWGGIANFVFMYETQGTLQPLWRSRELVKGHFWKVLAVMLIMWVLSWLVQMGFSQVKSISFIPVLLSLFILSPLSISILYSVFEKLKTGKPLKASYKNNGWVTVSVVGYILLFIILALTATVGINLLKNFDPSSFVPVKDGLNKSFPIPTIFEY